MVGRIERFVGGLRRAGDKINIECDWAANQFQPSLINVRNQWAKTLSSNSNAKIRVKKKSRISKICPVWLREPSSFVRLLLSCICTTFDPKFWIFVKMPNISKLSSHDINVIFDVS